MSPAWRRATTKTFSRESKDGKLALVVSPDGQDGSIAIRQNARLLIGMFDGAQSQQLPLQADRLTYVHLARGTLEVNGVSMKEGDALMLSEENLLEISAGQQAEVLVFDLPRLG
jgi:redox-sensitive bicupin YhaK (pirin superfamily)